MTRKTLRNLIVFICLILIIVAFAYFEWPFISGRLGLMNGNSAQVSGQKVNPDATVAVIQSDKEQAEDLTYDDIKSMVEKAVDFAGGLEDIIKDGDVVVLKPNIMTLWINSTGEQLPPDVNGITTDWRIVKATSELVRGLNPNGKIYVMESSAFQVTRMAMDSLNYTKEHMPEVDEFVCLEESGGYEEWDSPKLVKVTLPEGVGTYPDFMKPNKSPEFYMNRQYYEADVLIALPVLKNHHYTGLTGAIKCVGVGSSPPNIYGSWETVTITGATSKEVIEKLESRIQLNRSTKINHAPLFLDMWISDYFMCKPVDFVITDGLNGSQNGPDLPSTCKAGERVDNLMNMRLILASKDPLAADVVHSLIIGLDPYRINHLVLLSNKHIGQADPRYIHVTGNRSVQDVKKPFELNYQRGFTKTYTDYDPPEMTINALKIKDKKLYMSLDVSQEAIKVEVAVDGRDLGQVITGGYDNIIMDTGKIEQGEHTITVSASDHFLNCNKQIIKTRI
jgi:uncharacterized protein (DUF362 family)